MRKIVVEMTYNADVIEVPDEIEKNIKKVQRQFDKWIHDKTTEHKYWLYRDGKKDCPCFRGDAFVEYLNEVVLVDSDEKATLLESEVQVYDKTLKSIWF